MLIDLDEVREPLAEATPGDGRRSLWHKAFLAIGLLAVLSAGAAAPSPPPQIRVVADVGLPGLYGSIKLTGDAVIHPSRDTVAVYELDGRLRWSVPVPGSGGQYSTEVEAGMVLTHAFGPDGTHATVFGLADGRQLWSFQGMADVMGDVIAVHSGHGRGSVYAVHDRVTRALLWEAGALSFAADPEAGQILQLADDGTLSERELRTGKIIRSVRVGLPESEGYMLGFPGRDIAVFYFVRGDQQPRSIRLDRATLAVKPATTQETWGSEVYRPDCGQVRCEITVHGGLARVAVFDAVSGERLWEAEPNRHLQQLPSGLTSFTPHGSGHASPIQVHDPRTGRVLRTISDWRPIRAGPDDTEMAPVLLQERKGVRPAHTFLARLAPSGPRVLGSVRYEFIECKYHHEYLACMTVTRRLIVMKIKPAAQLGSGNVRHTPGGTG
jgi:hypothetical protein